MTPRSEERDLRDFLLVLWSRRYVLFLATALAAAWRSPAAMVAKEYRSTATLMIAGSKIPTVTVGEAARVDSRLYADTYAELIRSRSIASRVIRALNLGQPPHALDEETLTRDAHGPRRAGTMLLTVSLDYRDPGSGSADCERANDRRP